MFLPNPVVETRFTLFRFIVAVADFSNPFSNHFTAGFIGGADAAVDHVGDEVVGAADDFGGVAGDGNGFEYAEGDGGDAFMNGAYGGGGAFDATF